MCDPLDNPSFLNEEIICTGGSLMTRSSLQMEQHRRTVGTSSSPVNVQSRCRRENNNEHTRRREYCASHRHVGHRRRSDCGTTRNNTRILGRRDGHAAEHVHGTGAAVPGDRGTSQMGEDEGNSVFVTQETSLDGGHRTSSMASSLRMEQHAARPSSSGADLNGHYRGNQTAISESGSTSNRGGGDRDDHEPSEEANTTAGERFSSYYGLFGPRQFAEYPGAVFIRGPNARRRGANDEEDTIVIGGDDQESHQTPVYVVEQTEVSLRQPQHHPRRGRRLQRQSAFHYTMDQIGRSTHRLDPGVTERVPPNKGDGNKDRQCLLRSMEVLIILMLGLAAAVITTMVISLRASSSDPLNPSTSPASSRPHSDDIFDTTSRWALTAEIVGNVDTFGFAVDLNDSGTRIAIAAPKAHSGRGQVEVYEYVPVTENTLQMSTVRGDRDEWTRLGEPIIGDAVGDDASFGMDLSPDGNILAVGYPGNGNGFARVFDYHASSGWVQRGQTLAGPSLDSRFGAAVSLNENGTVLAVGAPLAGDQEQGMFQAYQWSDLKWCPIGDPRYGGNSGDRLGTSVGTNHVGDSVIVGVPNYDSPNGKNSGMAQVLKYVAPNTNATFENCTDDSWTDVSLGTVVGCGTGSRLGIRALLFESSMWFDYVTTSLANSAMDDYDSCRGRSFARDLEYISFRGHDGVFSHWDSKTEHLSAPEGLGYDVDFAVDDDRKFICTTSPNDNKRTGTTQCFGLHYTGYKLYEFSKFAMQIPLLPVGSGPWISVEENTFGPSVAVMEDEDIRLFATGYQSVLLQDGEDVPGVVRMFRFNKET